MKKTLVFTIIFSLLLAVSGAKALVTINAYPSADFRETASVFGEGPVYFSASDGSHCCSEVSAKIENEYGEIISVAAYDNGLSPDNKAGDGVYFGFFYAGGNLTDGNKSYIRSATGKTLRLNISFSAISYGAKEIATEFDKPVPVNLSGEFSENTIKLKWTASSDISGISHYLVYRHTEEIRESDIGKFSAVVVDGLNYTDRGIEDGKTYYYAIITVDRLRTYGYLSNMVSVSTPDKTAPKPIADLDHYQYKGDIFLNWTKPTDNVGVAKYFVYRGIKQITETAGAEKIGETNETTYTDKTARHRDIFYYVLSAVDAAGNIAEPSNNVFVQIDKSPPSRSIDLSAYQRKGGEIFLNWTDATDAETYKLYYFVYYPIESVEGLNYILLKENSHSDFPEKPAYYAVAAVDAYGNEAEPSNVVYAEPDNTLPSPPEDIRVLANPNGTVSISWGPSGSADLAFYRIYRAKESEYSLLAETKGTEFFDSGLEDGLYRYLIKAVDKVGNEDSRADAIAVSVKDTEINMVLLHPRNNSYVSQAQILVLGTADLDAEVTVESNGMVFGVVKSENGNFAGYANLTNGENIIRVRATDPNGNIKEYALKINNNFAPSAADLAEIVRQYAGKNITFEADIFDRTVATDPSLSGSDIFSGLVWSRNAEMGVVFGLIIVLVFVVLFSNRKTKAEIMKLVGMKLKYE